MNTRKIAKLKDKAYRDAFVSSQINVGLPFQIRALRERRGWKQSRLAGEAEMLQPRISAMETPGGAKFTLETLGRLASAFDVALVVRFAPFSELGRWSESFNPESFEVPSFADDEGLVDQPQEEVLQSAVAASTMGFAQHSPEMAELFARLTTLDLERGADAVAKIQTYRFGPLQSDVPNTMLEAKSKASNVLFMPERKQPGLQYNNLNHTEQRALAR